MKRILPHGAVILAAILFIAGLGWAGPPHRPRYYPSYYYYQPHYAPLLVVSPFGPSYYLPPVVAVTAPYFCILHNEGFVSRVGLLDHLSGTHKFPLQAATAICPDGTGSCIFPAY